MFLLSIRTLDHVCIKLTVTQYDQMATEMVHREHSGVEGGDILVIGVLVMATIDHNLK